MNTRRKSRGGGQAQRELLYGLHSVGEALRARRRHFGALLIRRGPVREELRALVDAAAEAGVALRQLSEHEFEARLPEAASNPQGVMLEVGPLPEHHSIRDLLEAIGHGPGGHRLLALDGVEDPQNVGALARVADAAGVSGLILTERRAPPISGALARASAGAIEWLPVARVTNLGRALSELQQAGFWSLGADPGASASLYELQDRLLSGDLVVVLGAEGRGLRPSIREALDHPVRIPMGGRVASLNVATAGAVVLFEVLRRAAGDG